MYTLTCNTKREAKNILKIIKRFIRKHGFITVADVYYVNDVSATFFDHHEGWSTVKGTKLTKNKNNNTWILSFPPREYVDDIIVSLI